MNKIEPENQIRKLRLAANISQEQLAQKTGLSLLEIKEFETGKLNPEKNKMEKIAVALGVSLDYLLFDEIKSNLDQKKS